MEGKETGLNEREGNSGNGAGYRGKSPINGRGNYRKFKKMAGESESNPHQKNASPRIPNRVINS